MMKRSQVKLSASCYQVPTLGKLFAPMCLCRTATNRQTEWMSSSLMVHQYKNKPFSVTEKLTDKETNNIRMQCLQQHQTLAETWNVIKC